MREGWLCPRCGRINAPFINYCECKVDDKKDKSEEILKELKENEILKQALSNISPRFPAGDVIYDRGTENTLYNLVRGSNPISTLSEE